MASDTSSRLFPLIVSLGRTNPWRGVVAVVLLFLSGLSEGIGVLSLLPLLSLSQSQSSAATSGAAGQIIDSLMRSVGLEATVGTLLVVVIVAVTLKGVLFLLALRQVGYVAADAATELRIELLRALASARWPYFTSRPTGSITNSIGTEAMRVSSMFTEACFFLAMIVQSAVFGIAALLISWRVTLATALFAAVLYRVLKYFIGISRRAGDRETELLKSLMSRLTSILGVMKPLKAMGRYSALQPLLESETYELNLAYRRQALSKAALVAIQEPFIALLLGIGFFVALSQDTATSELLVVAFLFYRIMSRVGSAQGHAQSVVTQQGALRSISEAIREARSESESWSGTQVPSLESGISIKEVSVGYGGRDVLKGLSIDIPAGLVTTVVGPSGSGKTTLVDLLSGLLVPRAGKILVDGTPLDDLDLIAWRRKIGYVSQDVVLLHDSVWMNVTLGQPEIGEAEVISALKAAAAWDFVSELPGRLEAVVGERGLALSGGQRQRIAIARAIVHLPSLLILDEATTALDPATEAEVLKSLLTTKGLTVLAISHQASVASFAHRSYTLPAGTPGDRT